MVRFAQWIIGLAVVAASGVATVMLLSPGEADRLREKNEALAREVLQQQRAIERLTAESRVAEVYVTEQVRAGEMVDGKPAPTDLTTMEFIELDREGHPLPSKRITVQGTRPRFEALVIKFSHDNVAMGHSLRGKSLALFTGVYGEHQAPVDAVRLDKAGDVPNVYRVSPEPSEFERKLWSRFWDYATDPALAEREGIREAQGEAPFKPMRKGEVWTITLQHNGGLNIKLRSGPRPEDRRGDVPANS